MEAQPGSLYLAFLLLSAGVSTVMGYLAYEHREQPGAIAFGVMVVQFVAWSVTEAMGLVTTDPAVAELARRANYLFLPFLPVALLVLALRYTGREKFVTRSVVGLVSVIPVLTVVLAVTNSLHGFLWVGGSFVSVPPFSIYEVDHRPWYWVHMIYTHGLIAFSSYLFVRWALTAEGAYRRQSQYILVGIAVPWVGNLASVFGFWTSPTELAPIFFTVSGVCIGIAVLRFKLLDLRPVARDTVVEVMREGVLVTDSEGRIIDANPAVARMLGASTTELLGRDVASAAPESLADAATGVSDAETVTLVTDGGERTFALERSRLPTGGTVVLLHDITERRRQAEQLERQNDRLERFGSVLSHDLRNPLNVTQGYVQLLADEAEGEKAEHARRALEGLDRMDELIDDTLALTREGPAVTDPERVDLAAVARAAWNGVETDGADLEISTDLTVEGDGERLKRLFENLFRNAVEHGSTGSQTQSDDAVEHGPSPEELVVRVHSIQNGFAVSDNGPGIPVAERESVLEFGFTTSDEGTGLGLSIVTEIAEAHGWRVAVTESESGGARIEFHGVEGAGGRETP